MPLRFGRQKSILSRGPFLVLLPLIYVVSYFFSATLFLKAYILPSHTFFQSESRDKADFFSNSFFSSVMSPLLFSIFLGVFPLLAASLPTSSLVPQILPRQQPAPPPAAPLLPTVTPVALPAAYGIYQDTDPTIPFAPPLGHDSWVHGCPEAITQLCGFISSPAYESDDWSSALNDRCAALGLVPKGYGAISQDVCAKGYLLPMLNEWDTSKWGRVSVNVLVDPALPRFIIEGPLQL